MNIQYLIKTSTIEEFQIVDSSLKELVDEVLKRIPDKYQEDFPTFSIFQGYSKRGGHVLDNTVTLDPDVLINNSGGNKDVIIGIISHEFAHVFLNHSANPEDLTMKLDAEYEADNLAVEWGFKEEIKVMRQTIGQPFLE